jgi:N-acetylglucosamine kinase-like BadF-type ATPase
MPFSLIVGAMKVIGLDAGATKTDCLLADEKGTVLAKARGSGLNLQLFSEDEVEFALSSLAGEVLSVSKAARVDALCIGMAGAGRERDFRIMKKILERVGAARDNLVTHDAAIALVAGAGERFGVVLTVGTGAAAYGVDRDGREARAGGWGPLLGDEGSAYWMGLRALRAVMRAYDGRSVQTLLTRPILERLGVEHEESLVHRVYRELAREEIGALAPLVQQAADLGDGEAQSIIDDAAREFVRAVESVIGKLDLAGESFRMVLSGGLWKAVPVLRQDFEGLIKKVAPWASVSELEVEPAQGAVAIALDHLRSKASREGRPPSGRGAAGPRAS